MDGRARFASGLSEHPVPGEAVGEVVGTVLEGLGGVTPDLAFLVVSPHHVGALEDIAPAVRTLLQPGLLLGCTAVAVVGGAREVEDGPAISLLAAKLARGEARPIRMRAEPTPDGIDIVGWPEGEADLTGTVLLVADPFSFPADAFLARVDEELPHVTVLGGLASAARGPGGNRLVLDGEVVVEGAVGAWFEDAVEVEPVVSQGCRPIGSPYTVTRAERNVIHELAGRTPLERLEEIAASLLPDERELLRHGLHVGRVVDEHRADFDRGDFIVRNVMGVDPEIGAMAVGDLVEVGQTVQFHLRDAAAADEDLKTLLAGKRADAALLFTCNGRGRRLFGTADHDASVVSSLVGPLPLGGMFCAGEFGPVGGRNFLHGFTASVALLRA